jgi:hypothetical protein
VNYPRSALGMFAGLCLGLAVMTTRRTDFGAGPFFGRLVFRKALRLSRSPWNLGWGSSTGGRPVGRLPETAKS